MIAYILTLIADKAAWPGQREHIRKRFAEAVGSIPEVKFRDALREGLGDRKDLELCAGENSEAVVRECRKVDDEAFERAVRRVLKRKTRTLGEVLHWEKI